MLRLVLQCLPGSLRSAFWRRCQCPAYHEPDRYGRWRCIRFRHRDAWHHDARGAEWPGEAVSTR